MGTSLRRASGSRVVRLLPASFAYSAALRPVAIDHPRNAELVGQHAETGGPERLLDRHAHGTVVGERRKNAFSFFRIVGLDRHVEALRFLEMIGWCIGAHQYVVAKDEACVHDL